MSKFERLDMENGYYLFKLGNLLSNKNISLNKLIRDTDTDFKVLKRYENFTLLEIKIDTGRTHQIRVHMAEIKHPVVGDIVYSNGKNPFSVVRANASCKKHRVCSSNIWRKVKNWSTFASIF